MEMQNKTQSNKVKINNLSYLKSLNWLLYNRFRGQYEVLAQINIQTASTQHMRVLRLCLVHGNGME